MVVLPAAFAIPQVVVHSESPIYAKLVLDDRRHRLDKLGSRLICPSGEHFTRYATYNIFNLANNPSMTSAGLPTVTEIPNELVVYGNSPDLFVDLPLLTLT